MACNFTLAMLGNNTFTMEGLHPGGTKLSFTKETASKTTQDFLFPFFLIPCAAHLTV